MNVPIRLFSFQNFSASRATLIMEYALKAHDIFSFTYATTSGKVTTGRGNMFELLFNSRIVEQVLFYMISNNKCYASELRQAFGIPIFGIQRALTRLENQGILVSTIEGRNRLYHWNPRYYFLTDFKAFISKAYSTLPDTIKKKYYERPIRRRPRKKGKPL